ncbi:MAG: hypothetical protein ACR2QW_04015, partial [bacterium]
QYILRFANEQRFNKFHGTFRAICKAQPIKRVSKKFAGTINISTTMPTLPMAEKGCHQVFEIIR